MAAPPASGRFFIHSKSHTVDGVGQPFTEIDMILNDMGRNRKEFDLIERATKREALLRHIGPRTPGLLVWHFGAGGELRNPSEIPVAKIQEFAHKYA